MNIFDYLDISENLTRQIQEIDAAKASAEAVTVQLNRLLSKPAAALNEAQTRAQQQHAELKDIQLQVKARMTHP